MVLWIRLLSCWMLISYFFLFVYQGNPNVQTIEGETPLHIAVIWNRTLIVEMLLVRRDLAKWISRIVDWYFVVSGSWSGYFDNRQRQKHSNQSCNHWETLQLDTNLPESCVWEKVAEENGNWSTKFTVTANTI